MVFFRCMAALLSPVHSRGEGIKWGLVSYAIATFSFMTMHVAINLHTQSIPPVDNHKSLDNRGSLPPRPVVYQSSIWSGALVIIPTITFLLNNWLVGGPLVSPLSDPAATCPGI